MSLSSARQNLREEITSAFVHIRNLFIASQQTFDDPTIQQYIIAYDKKLQQVQVLKSVLIDGKKVVLEPPVWISKSHNQKIHIYDTNERIIILEVPAQIPNMNEQLEKIIGQSEQ